MMTRAFLVSICLVVFCGVAASVSDYQRRTDFVNAMDKARGEKRRLQDLRKQLLAKARPVPRALEEEANEDVEEEANDEANDDAVYVNADGLDLSSYSLKYVGCQAVNTWSDNMAKDEDSNTAFALEQFVILRMCPSTWCSRYRKFGCGSNYGQYMILMEDYLAIMKEYHYARFATYCGTCSQCMGSYVSYQATEDGNRRRRLADDDAAGDDAVNDDEAAGDDAYNDDAGDDAMNNDDAAGDDAYNDDEVNNNDDAAAGDEVYNNNDDDAMSNQWAQSNCDLEEQCANYEEVCEYHQYHGADYENFMECTAIEMDDGQVLYLGPHCGSDKHTITIGVFEDQYCSSYLGDVGSYEEIQGYNIDENSLAFFYPSTCISCSDEVRNLRRLDSSVSPFGLNLTPMLPSSFPLFARTLVGH